MDRRRSTQPRGTCQLAAFVQWPYHEQYRNVRQRWAVIHQHRYQDGTGRDLADLGAGLLIAGGNRWSLESTYDYPFNHSYKADQVMVRFALAL